jgi:dTDP-4-dehydrorhamnose 3,5-epimerase
MQFFPTAIDGAYAVTLEVKTDTRGRFKRHFCAEAFAQMGLVTDFVQMNHSVTRERGVVRGMHFQHPPHAEAKLVSCMLGRAYDVAIDLRRSSPTFLKWAAVELDEARAFYIPKGCAHGFQTLTDQVHLTYLHSEFYESGAEGGVRFDDTLIGIVWPLPVGIISDRDRDYPPLPTDFEGLEL